jgi:hypothetical protein
MDVKEAQRWLVKKLRIAVVRIKNEVKMANFEQIG